ncbi:MAG: restriction endonuclease subunit S [Pseudomonadales bacterium]|nr:restriction endonuclease subunit S [Pseudomonadales bacterium]
MSLGPSSSTGANPITDHLDLWSSATQQKATVGRGKNGKVSPHGINKLRELILELAVRGKLVPQDPNDESAGVLLEKISLQKSKLAKGGGFKKQKKLPLIADEEKLGRLPNGWEFVRYGSIVDITTGKLDANAAVVGGKYQFFTCSQTPSEIDSYRFDCAAVLLAGNGDFNVKFYEGKFDAYQRTYVIQPIFSDLKFLYYLTLSEIDRITQHNRGSAIAYLKLADITNPVMALPPLAEQHRIVAKVDELMALCDQLEQQQTDSLHAHQTLVRVFLDRMVDNANTHQPIHIELIDAFDTLFTTEEAIDQLKQTILQLAVMGKLVPQNPNDEPASLLLEKIAAEKQQLIKDKKIKKQKPLPPISDEEKPFELPAGWEWARVGDVLSLKHGFAFKSKNFVQDPTPFVLTTPGNFYETGGFRNRGDKTKYFDGSVDPSFILEPGDLIIPMTEQAPGLLGSAAFIPSDGKNYIHNQRLGKLTSYCGSISGEFLYWFFNSPYLRSELSKSCSGTTVRHTSPDKIFRVLFPVCSLPEQHRIVAKVDELMARCDTLKARLNEAQTTQAQLADAVVEHAIQ